MVSAVPRRLLEKWCATATAALLLCTTQLVRADFPLRLDDVTRETGIDFVHTDGGSGRRYIVESVSAGLALFDYDGDGLIDVYFLNGAPLPQTDSAQTPLQTPPRNALYRNVGNFRFIDVTEQAGVGDIGYGLGVAVGDFDNDGDGDLYLNNFGPNVFYRNNGDGTFSDISRQTGTIVGDHVGAGAAFLDADNDGDLDLYVAKYLRFSYDAVGPTQWRGVPVYPCRNSSPPIRTCSFATTGTAPLPTSARKPESSATRGVAWAWPAPITTTTAMSISS